MPDATVFPVIGSKDRLVDRVVDEIQKMIVNGQLRQGMKLPPERDFAEQMVVSRTVVREAVHILVAKGLLETRHGVGTVVRQVSSTQLFEPLEILLKTRGFTLDHMHQVRSILEVEIAGLAASQATQEDLARLGQIVSQMEACTQDPQAYAELDAEFHSMLARISYNPLLVVLSDSLGGLMQEVRLSVSDYPDLFKTAMPDHRAILERVAARDATGARQTMRVHLEHARAIQEAFLRRKEKE